MSAGEAYDRIAGRYDARFVHAGRAPWTAAFAPHLRPGLAVLDAGCGTGTDLLHLAAAGCRATGVDLSPGMLAIARDRLAVAGLHAVLHQGSLTTVAHLVEPASVDLVVSGFAALNTVDDLPAAAAGLAAALRPGGLALLHFLTPGGLYDRAGHLARGHLRRAALAWRVRQLNVLVGETAVPHRLFSPGFLLDHGFSTAFDPLSCWQVGMLTPDDGPSRLPSPLLRALGRADRATHRLRPFGSLGRFAILTLRRK